MGVGNIGAEALRLAKPFDMKLIAHDPFADAALMARLVPRKSAIDLMARATKQVLRAGDDRAGQP